VRRDPWLWAALVAGGVLRTYRLDVASLWLDEAISARVATLFPGQVLGAAAADVHPPGYYLLLHAWVMPWTGWGAGPPTEWALRSLSAACGVLALPLVYRLALGSAGDRTTARWAVCLAAVSPFAVAASREARACALLGLLWLAQWAVWNRARRASGWRPTVALGLLLAAGLYVHYLTALWWLALALLPWLEEDRRARLPRDWWIATGIGAAAFVPWLPTFLDQAAGAPRSWIPFRHSPLLVLRTLGAFLRGGGTRSDELFLWSLPVAYLLLRGARRNGWGPCALATVPLAAAYGLSFRLNVFAPRYFLGAAAACCIGVAAGVRPSPRDRRAFPRRAAAVLVLAACVVGIAAGAATGGAREDWRALVQALESEAAPGAAVVFPFVAPFAPVRYYLRRDDLELLPGLVDPGGGGPTLEPNLADGLWGVPEVLFVDYLADLYDPGGEVLRTIRGAGFRSEEVLFDAPRLRLVRLRKAGGEIGSSASAVPPLQAGIPVSVAEAPDPADGVSDHLRDVSRHPEHRHPERRPQPPCRRERCDRPGEPPVRAEEQPCRGPGGTDRPGPRDDGPGGGHPGKPHEVRPVADRVPQRPEARLAVAAGVTVVLEEERGDA
jgi:hypothetical protein